MNTKQTNFRLSSHCKAILAVLSQKLGINNTSVVELAVRKLAEKEKVKVD